MAGNRQVMQAVLKTQWIADEDNRMSDFNRVFLLCRVFGRQRLINHVNGQEFACDFNRGYIDVASSIRTGPPHAETILVQGNQITGGPGKCSLPIWSSVSIRSG